MKNPVHIKDIIKKIKLTTQFVNVAKITKINPYLKDFIPAKYHNFLVGVSLRNKHLTIGVTNNAALMELENFYKQGLLNYLQASLPESFAIKKISFKFVGQSNYSQNSVY